MLALSIYCMYACMCRWICGCIVTINFYYIYARVSLYRRQRSSPIPLPPLYAPRVRTYKDPSHHARYNDPIRLLPFIHSHSLFYLFYLLALPFIRVRLPLASPMLASSLLFYAALLPVCCLSNLSSYITCHTCLLPVCYLLPVPT